MGKSGGRAVLMIAMRWQNDAVMCFDENGDQIPELQGMHGAVREKVLAAAHASTSFKHARYPGTFPDGKQLRRVPREEW